VGLAGLTLGGGIGYATRRRGWTADNVTGMEVVTADGEIVRASERDNPDLFWALCGGGGNFGVVTGFDYRLFPVGPQIVGGAVAWSGGDTSAVMEMFRAGAARAHLRPGAALRTAGAVATQTGARQAGGDGGRLSRGRARRRRITRGVDQVLRAAGGRRPAPHLHQPESLSRWPASGWLVTSIVLFASGNRVTRACRKASASSAGTCVSLAPLWNVIETRRVYRSRWVIGLRAS
jgi:FAD/FMN-containing dehydrogenase